MELRTEILSRMSALVNAGHEVDVTVGNTLSTSVSLWHRYFEFLDVIGERYAVASAAFVEDTKATLAFVAATPHGQELTIPDARERNARSVALSVRVDLELESFLLFSKILLDRIADTANFYFKVRLKGSGSTHSRFARRFARLCSEHGLTVPATSKLQSLFQEVGGIVVWRNKVIEHPSDPRRLIGKGWSGDEQPRTSVGMIYPTPEELRQPAELLKVSDTPAEVLRKIERYTMAMLRFFEHNKDHSVIATPPGAVASPAEASAHHLGHHW